MFYTLFLAVCVLLAVVLISFVCYFLLLLISRTRRKCRVYIVMPDGENENAQAEQNMRKMVERYNNIKLIQIGDMPDVISFYWDD